MYRFASYLIEASDESVKVRESCLPWEGAGLGSRDFKTFDWYETMHFFTRLSSSALFTFTSPNSLVSGVSSSSGSGSIIVGGSSLITVAGDSLTSGSEGLSWSSLSSRSSWAEDWDSLAARSSASSLARFSSSTDSIGRFLFNSSKTLSMYGTYIPNKNLILKIWKKFGKNQKY